jgi:hypothetical protein
MSTRESPVVLLDQFCDQSGPTRLVARADAGAVVAVEVFVEWDQIAPVRVVLEFFRAAENRSSLIHIAKKESASADAKFPRPPPSVTPIVLPDATELAVCSKLVTSQTASIY